ncbi:MAG TPA: hypothetical protein VF818_05495 [Ktedonobacterales bacterium]
MAITELERLERRMERRWFDLAMAEQRNQPPHVLDRMYNAYLRALDEFVAYERAGAARLTTARLAS